jgi:hypothetical protein
MYKWCNDWRYVSLNPSGIRPDVNSLVGYIRWSTLGNFVWIRGCTEGVDSYRTKKHKKAARTYIIQ